MPISVDYEFTFGGVPCLAVTTTGSRPTARVYLIVDEGLAIRPLVDNAGAHIEFMGTSSDDALARALDYLETRFGTRGAARRWHEPRSQARVWTILHDAPVRPHEGRESLG